MCLHSLTTCSELMIRRELGTGQDAFLITRCLWDDCLAPILMFHTSTVSSSTLQVTPVVLQGPKIREGSFSN